MGIYDRDYYRGTRGGGSGVSSQTAVTTLILINVGVWLLELVFRGDHNGGLRRFLACSPGDLFDGFPQIWRLLTANFVHAHEPMHVAINMLFLYFFGREVEGMYGKREFLIFYLTAGVLSILAEVISLRVAGNEVSVLGASGAVAGVVVLFTLYYPNRQILFMFFLPMPIWLFCGLFFANDIFNASRAQGPTGVAHLAHLFGGAYGFLFKFYDLRWSRVRRLVGRGPASGRGQRPVVTSRRRTERRQEEQGTNQQATRDGISRRIDEILAKIGDQGMGSLSDEEREFLKENSKRYRSS